MRSRIGSSTVGGTAGIETTTLPSLSQDQILRSVVPIVSMLFKTGDLFLRNLELLIHRVPSRLIVREIAPLGQLIWSNPWFLSRRSREPRTFRKSAGQAACC